jgi:polysaccharide export outer membrane protein
MNNIVKIPWPVLVMLVLPVVCAAAWQANESADRSAAEYVLGPDDQILIRALDPEQISGKPVLIETNGYISLPMVGRVRAAGLTVQQLEAEIVSRLKRYIREPQASVSVAEFGSQPVSVVGAVGNPGVVQLRGHKTLLEVISQAGGLKNEAGNSITVTRRRENGPIPLPSALPDSSGEFSVAEVSIKSIMEGRNPQENIQVRPKDVITVPRAEFIYVIGAVRRPGGFVLNEREHISVLQALSLAEGLDRVASAGNARILRSSDSAATRTEIPVDLNKILAGKTGDVPLLANDVLFIPNSMAKNATLRSIEAAIQVGTGVAIWRR